MTERVLTPVQEQYLKVIWSLGETDGAPVTNSVLAKSVGQRTSTVSDMLKRLDDDGYVSHQRYGAVTLTDEGRAAAVQMVRRHRLLEAFLTKTLGYTWDEVHQEADALEHVASDKMIERIAARLGDPTHDPHGDPIPTPHGDIAADDDIPLTDLPAGTPARIVRVGDMNPEFLRYLTENGIAIGSRLQRVPAAPFATDVLVRVGGSDRTVGIGHDLARTISVAAED